jgi:Pregnancy-associated plasma protein-A/Protein of unknown function (DUF1565)
MKTLSLFLCLAALCSLGGRAGAQYIELRVSVHVILNPTTGARPSGITDDLVYTAQTNANTWMALYYRGYRFRITEVTNVGGPAQGGASGPSKWYGLDFRSTPEPWNTFQLETQSDSRYRLRTDAVNFYVATGVAGPGNSGGACPIAPGEVTRIACQGFVNSGGWWLVHETGHFFGLSHTFAGEGAGCVPGDDGVSDTLPDSNCWNTLDDVANGTYGQAFNSLTIPRQTNVVNLLFNVMSYHNAVTKDTVENVLTELQLDVHADIASTPAGSGGRAAFSSGRTYFISTAGSDFGTGRSTSPYRTVGKGVTNSAAGDILLLRPGNYNQALTINRPVTLRAPRTGWATIGQP